MADLGYAPEVLALWTEKDEAACKEWCDGKIKEFEAGGKIKEKYATIEELQVSVLRVPARSSPSRSAQYPIMVSRASSPLRSDTFGALRWLNGACRNGWTKRTTAREARRTRR